MQTVVLFMIFAELLGPAQTNTPPEEASVRQSAKVEQQSRQKTPQIERKKPAAKKVLLAQKTPPVAKKSAEEIKLDAAIDAMQAAYETTKSFTADFTQKYTYTLLQRTQESSGKVTFQKPGMMRWDYTKPSQKSFIVDGKSLWVFQPEDQMAMVNRCFKQDGLTASVAFLWGSGDIRKEFNVSLFGGVFGEKNDIHLELLPKQKNSIFAKLILVVDPVNHRVKQSIVVDPAGNINRFLFSNLKFNGKVQKKTFAFTPPKGVHVSDMPGSCAAPQ